MSDDGRREADEALGRSAWAMAAARRGIPVPPGIVEESIPAEAPRPGRLPDLYRAAEATGWLPASVRIRMFALDRAVEAGGRGLGHDVVAEARAYEAFLTGPMPPLVEVGPDEKERG